MSVGGAGRAVAGTADAVVDLARLALAFGRVDRTAVTHPDGYPESDTDHTVMLSWVAPALAELLFPDLDVGLVAQFAVVHDAPEVYAGDTQTLRIDEAGLAAKRGREELATGRLVDEFATRLPWFARTLVVYEAQDSREARFVRAVDKVLPRAVHLLNDARELAGQFDIDVVEWHRLAAQSGERLARFAWDFPALLALREELGRRIEALLPEPSGASSLAGKVGSDD
jgi:putative hydrolase of HD superfamily